MLLWAQAEFHAPNKFGEEDTDDQETWMVKRMCRSQAIRDLEIYDLAWSPDGRFFVTGSTDNVARIYDASTGGRPLLAIKKTDTKRDRHRRTANCRA